MPPKRNPQAEIDKLIEKMGMCEIGSPEYAKLKEKKGRWERAKHEGRKPEPFVLLVGTAVFVRPNQEDPDNLLSLLTVAMQNPGFSGACKARTATISSSNAVRDERTKEAYQWLSDVCGAQLDNKTAEFLLRFGELVHRIREAHGVPDQRHLEVMNERIAFFLKGKHARACVEAMQTFCTPHFPMFVQLVNAHPKAQHSAVKAGDCDEDEMESPDACGGSSAAVARGGGSAAVARGGGSAAVARGGGAVARGGGAVARGGGKADKVKPFHVLRLLPGASTTPKNENGKFANGAVIYLLGSDGCLLAYFRTEEDLANALPTLPGAVRIFGEDLAAARLLNKESYDSMQAKRLAQAAGVAVSAPASSKREGDGAAISSKRVKDDSEDDSAEESD